MDEDEIQRETERIFALLEMHDEFVFAIERADNLVLIRLISKLTPLPHEGRLYEMLKGRRDSVKAELEMRSNRELVKTLKGLDRTATYLAIAGVVLAAVQVIIALCKR